MKCCAFIPVKSQSKRVEGKNFKLLGEKSLYKRLLDKMVDTNFDEVYVNTDSLEVKEYSHSLGFKVIDRPAFLSEDSANGNDLLLFDADQVPDCDYYFQIFITAPFLKVETINACIKKLKESKENDSIFTSVDKFSWFWFDKRPINYIPRELPRSQDAKPVIEETTALYGIRRDALISCKCRIGDNPIMYPVDEIEAIDLDTHFDFLIAETVLNNGLNND